LPALTNAQLLDLQRQVTEIHAARPIIDYVHAILQFTRGSERFVYGLSPRAAVLRRASSGGR
jgi:MoxR-like ATPase